jgi:hypothetical protein
MFKISLAIFVQGTTTPGIEVITKLDVAHQVPSYSYPQLAFIQEA